MSITQDSCRLGLSIFPSGAHRLRVLPVRAVASTPQRRPLVHSFEVQVYGPEDSRRSGHGRLPERTQFTRLAKERVREGAAVLEQEFGRRVVFGTGTLPGSTNQAFCAIAQWSGYLVARLKQHYADTAAGTRFMYVWEFQKRGALHLHYVLAHHDLTVLRKIKREWHDQWCKLLELISIKSGVDVFARDADHTWRQDWSAIRTDAQFCRKSVGRYLSKYLSKSAGTVGDTSFYCPSRWWGIDNWIRAETSRRTFSVLSKVAHIHHINLAWERMAGELISNAAKVFVWKRRDDYRARTLVGYIERVPMRPLTHISCRELLYATYAQDYAARIYMGDETERRPNEGQTNST